MTSGGAPILAKGNTKEIAKKAIEKIRSEAEINEAYFVGLLWSNPFDNYGEYGDLLTYNEFIHDVWAFYFELGKNMYKKGIKTFDVVTVNQFVSELNVEVDFERYGGFATIDDVVNIVKNNIENIGYYYETIKKNYIIRELVELFGEKVLVNTDKYKWEKMTKEQLITYWHDKMNKISLNTVNHYETENLYIDPDEFIKRLIKDSAEMLPFYDSRLMNSITQGVPRGHVTMIGGFGGTGKTSIVSGKFVMSCIENGEKTLVILNEEDAQSFRQKIVLSILFHEFHTGIDRKKFVKGDIGERERELIHKAFQRMHELINGDEALIKLVFMERYVMKDLEKIVKYWANRGYVNLLIDTHKVSESSEYDKRWETFVEDMKTIYRLTRKNAGGLNLRTVVTFQLSDSAMKRRFLDYEAIGEGKAAKNEASIVFMFRPIWDDEYKDGKHELECWRLRKIGENEYDKEYFKLERGKTYYLWFTPKNRFGSSTETGQPVLILEPIFNANSFKEVGWTYVSKDRG